MLLTVSMSPALLLQVTKKKGRQPSHEKLTAIADLFEVPVDYLLNDEEDTITLSPSRLTTNSDDELNLLLAYRSLSRKFIPSRGIRF